ncbi:MAG: phosphoribosylanthranilate isomerase [Pedobacter sp.]|nr:MAG: phosphoribosylanthranilate isomerase [Pedobacter sp.]
MNIKVCGITTLKQLQQLEGLEIDFAGLIFYKDSPRYIGDKLEGAAIKDLDLDVKKVGVFVNPEMIDVLDAIDAYGLDVVQLHGDETPEMCEDLSSEVEVIKAFSINSEPVLGSFSKRKHFSSNLLVNVFFFIILKHFLQAAY